MRTSYPDLFAAIGTTFGEGDGASTFNLPDLIDRFAQGNGTPGQKIEAGLPDITGTFAATTAAGESGAFKRKRDIYLWWKDGTNPGASEVDFYASRSNPIYGASATVQPPALGLLPCIKAFDALQAGVPTMNTNTVSSGTARTTIGPQTSKAWVNFDASSGEITIRNACHVDKVIRVEKGVFDIIFDG